MWARHINPSLVLVQPRKTRPFITERLLMGCKGSNQTNKSFQFCIWRLKNSPKTVSFPFGTFEVKNNERENVVIHSGLLSSYVSCKLYMVLSESFLLWGTWRLFTSRQHDNCHDSDKTVSNLQLTSAWNGLEVVRTEQSTIFSFFAI